MMACADDIMLLAVGNWSAQIMPHKWNLTLLALVDDGLG